MQILLDEEKMNLKYLQLVKKLLDITDTCKMVLV